MLQRLPGAADSDPLLLCCRRPTNVMRSACRRSRSTFHQARCRCDVDRSADAPGSERRSSCRRATQGLAQCTNLESRQLAHPILLNVMALSVLRMKAAARRRLVRDRGVLLSPLLPRGGPCIVRAPEISRRRLFCPRHHAQQQLRRLSCRMASTTRPQRRRALGGLMLRGIGAAVWLHRCRDLAVRKGEPAAARAAALV
jgi:hypothetical protein